jgi:hypothetical protein
VYQIKNNANGKIFIAASPNLQGRRQRFEFEQKTGGLGKNDALHHDWEEFGGESFSFETLEKLKNNDDPSRDLNTELAALEKKWLERLQPYDEKGYNKHPKTAK